MIFHHREQKLIEKENKNEPCTFLMKFFFSTKTVGYNIVIYLVINSTFDVQVP